MTVLSGSDPPSFKIKLTLTKGYDQESLNDIVNMAFSQCQIVSVLREREGTVLTYELLPNHARVKQMAMETAEFYAHGKWQVEEV